MDLSLEAVQDKFAQNAPIVHFCGYANNGEFDITNELPEMLSLIFQVKGEKIKCVLLVACHSPNQASFLSQHVDCVIGLPKQIPYKEAMKFAVNFYSGLSQKMNVEKAITWGTIPLTHYLKKAPADHHPKILKNSRISNLSEITILEDPNVRNEVVEEILKEIQKKLMDQSYTTTSKAV